MSFDTPRRCDECGVLYPNGADGQHLGKRWICDVCREEPAERVDRRRSEAEDRASRRLSNLLKWR